MFKGYLIAKRYKGPDPESGLLGFLKPEIFEVEKAPYIRCTNYSGRNPYFSFGDEADLEVFYIELHDDDVKTVRNDPNSYIVNLDWSDFEPQPFANWLNAKGITKGKFQGSRARHGRKDDQLMNAKFNAAEAEM